MIVSTVDTYCEEKMIVSVADIYYENDGIYLANFEVFKKYRGKGYANIMMNALINVFNIDTLIVYQNNTIAINLYKKYGFEIIEAYHANDLNEDVFYMKRNNKSIKRDKNISQIRVIGHL